MLEVISRGTVVFFFLVNFFGTDRLVTAGSIILGGVLNDDLVQTWSRFSSLRCFLLFLF